MNQRVCLGELRGGAGWRHPGTRANLPPSPTGLATSDCFQDGGGLGGRLCLPPSTPTSSRRPAGEGEELGGHFPPEVGLSLTTVYIEGGASASLPCALLAPGGAGPMAAHKQKMAKPLSPARLRGRNLGRRLGVCWETRAKCQPRPPLSRR